MEGHLKSEDKAKAFLHSTTLQSIRAGPYEGNEDIATTTVSF